MGAEHRRGQGGWHWRGYLPHLDSSQLIQAVTFRLNDALPASVVRILGGDGNQDSSPDLRQRVAALLDAGHGSCLLGQPWAAAIVEGVLQHFDGDRYRLVAWVVMPNHVHVIIECRSGQPLGDVVRSWKSYSARRINALQNQDGCLWYPDYFDRFIRDSGHLSRAVDYVHNNPVVAGLVAKASDWRYSSAWWARQEQLGRGTGG